MIWGDKVRVYALEKDSLLVASELSVGAFHSEAFRKILPESGRCQLCTLKLQHDKLTSIDLLYPLVNLLQAERSFRATIVLILINLQNLLLGTGQGSS